MRVHRSGTRSRRGVGLAASLVIMLAVAVAIASCVPPKNTTDAGSPTTTSVAPSTTTPASTTTTTAAPTGTGPDGVWRMTATKRTCALLGSTWTCGTPSNVTLTFSLDGPCHGTDPCRLSDLTGSWGWNLSGGTTCMTAFGTSYQATSGTVTATFTLDAADSIGVQAVVPQSAVPVTAVITDGRATRVGDLTTAPLPCP